jgi:uncharacterized protein (DUF488 family)
VIVTIGHSNHELTHFLSLLSRHGVQVVADVRSQPYSRFRPHFNRERLAESLKAAGIEYIFLGRELGARRTEPDAYRGNQARYDLVRELPAFQSGLDRVRAEAASHRLALLCAEKDPLTCHRTILIGRELRRDPALDIVHILDDGRLETMAAAEERLLALSGLSAGDLFGDDDRRASIERAYDWQADRIAYSR